ncbi:MAG: hypothetical protein DRP11_03155, partial [Candidatus Aenigmatarchaeota archaeon]
MLELNDIFYVGAYDSEPEEIFKVGLLSTPLRLGRAEKILKKIERFYTEILEGQDLNVSDPLELE